MLSQHWYPRRGCVCPVGRNLPCLVSETMCVPIPPLFPPIHIFLSSPASCKLLVETSSISHLTPSLISHCALVHCDSSVMTFDTIVDTWLDKAPVQHNLSAMRSVCLSSQTVYGRVQTLLPVLLFHVALRLWPQ